MFQLSAHNHLHFPKLTNTIIFDKHGHSLMPYTGALTVQAAFKVSKKLNAFRLKSGIGYHYLTGSPKLERHYGPGRVDLDLPVSILGYDRNHDVFLMIGFAKPFTLRNTNLFFAYSLEIHYRVSKIIFESFGPENGYTRDFHNLEFGCSFPHSKWLEAISLGYKVHMPLHKSFGINTTINISK